MFAGFSARPAGRFRDDSFILAAHRHFRICP
jgi:hypothetical protein